MNDPRLREKNCQKCGGTGDVGFCFSFKCNRCKNGRILSPPEIVTWKKDNYPTLITSPMYQNKFGMYEFANKKYVVLSTKTRYSLFGDHDRNEHKEPNSNIWWKEYTYRPEILISESVITFFVYKRDWIGPNFNIYSFFDLIC